MQNTLNPSHFVNAIKGPAIAPADAQWFLFAGDQVVMHAVADDIQIVTTQDPGQLGLAPLRTQYVGAMTTGNQATHCYTGFLDETAALPAGYVAMEVRRLFDHQDETLLGVVFRAKQVAQWDRDHQFCGRCGSPTEDMAAERAKRCPRCGLSSYPRLSPAVIVAVTRQGERGEEILLARNHRFPAGRYSVVAGFVEVGETLEDCVHREVLEEVGVQVTNVCYFGSQPWPFPHSLMIGFTAEHAGGEIRLEESEIADARWFGVADLPQVPPKVSIARRLIDAFVTRNQVAATVRSW